MNTTKALLVLSAIGTVAVANAALTLTPVAGTFKYGGGFSGLLSTPSYNNALGTANLTVSPSGPVSFGSINKWWFIASQSSGTITQPLSYDVTLSGITANTSIFATLTAYKYNPATNSIVGGALGPGLTVVKNVDAYTGGTGSTQDIKFAYDVSSWNVSNVEYKLNVSVYNAVPEPTSVAAMAVGVIGLMIRRRRTSK
jgi:hypothetical protein